MIPGWSPNSAEWTEEQWWYFYGDILKYTVTEGEKVEDALSAAYHLGARRSELLGEAFYAGTSPTGPLLILCWYPLKEKVNDGARNYLITTRRPLIDDLFQTQNFEPLNEKIPDELLSLPISEYINLIKRESPEHLFN